VRDRARGGLRGGERFGRVPGGRWAAAGLGRCAADQEREGSGGGSTGMGACRMLCRSHDQLQVSWLWLAGRMGWCPCGPRFLRGCPDCRIWSDGRAIGLFHE